MVKRMYELRIEAYQDFEKDFRYISSTFLPRVGDIIDDYKVQVCEEDDSITTYIQKLEVQSVHFHLFDDNSSMPIVYANVIKCEILKGESNE